MSEMVERVAMRMAQMSKARVAGMYTINALPMDGEENFLDLARAAIEAMSEPNDEMMKAGWMAQYRSIGASDAEARQMANGKILLEHEKSFLRAGWSAAIDAALKD